MVFNPKIIKIFAFILIQQDGSLKTSIAFLLRYIIHQYIKITSVQKIIKIIKNIINENKTDKSQ